MKEHGIKWLNMPGYKGETWNPVVGCRKVSDGCRNCYAEEFAGRLAAMGHEQYKTVVDDNGWNGEACAVADAFDKPLKWKKPRMIFVCSMGDLFFEGVPDDVITRVFTVISFCPQHVFCVLTKRPERFQDWFERYRALPFQNVWLGVTAENQEQAYKRIPHLLRCNAPRRFVSVEPMLEKVDLYDFTVYPKRPAYTICEANECGGCSEGDEPCEEYRQRIDNPEPALDWVICGGESGSNARPMSNEWASFLKEQCEYAEVPFFMKQMSGKTKAEREAIPKHLILREWPEVLR